MLESYFSSLSEDTVVGKQYKQWITLFDHPDDDIYDGILGEDDDEEPRVRIQFTVEEASQKQTAKNHQEINVSKVPTATGRGSVKQKPAQNPATGVARPNSGRNTVAGPVPSGPGGPNKRSTSSGGHGQPGAQSNFIDNKRAQSQAEALRREKEGQLAQIHDEIKKYDIDLMREDTLHKVQTIANNLAKSERVLMADEKKNLRFLERVGAM